MRDPVAARLLLARAASEIGDYIGAAALIVLTYRRTGSVLAPAAVFVAGSAPTLLVGTVFSSWLDRPARRPALVFLCLLGAGATAMVAAWPGFATALVASFVIGVSRTAYLGISTGAVTARSTPEVQEGYFTAAMVIDDATQVLGFASGATATLALGASVALGFDALSFLAGAAVLAGLPALARAAAGDVRPGPGAGVRIIRARPLLTVAAVLVASSMWGTSIPETLGPRLASGVALPFVMAAFPAGSVLASLAWSRLPGRGRPATQARTAIAGGGSFALGAGLLWAGAGAWGIAAANFAAGATSVWIIGARTLFARETPAANMAQVEATMVAFLSVVQGVGTVALAGLATAVDPATAYAAEAAVGVGVASWALAASSRRTAAPAPATVTPR